MTVEAAIIKHTELKTERAYNRLYKIERINKVDLHNNQQEIKQETKSNKKVEDQKVTTAIFEHSPIDILKSTKQEFLAGYKVLCVDAMRVQYTVQCVRISDSTYEIFMHTSMPMSIKVNLAKAITCYEGLCLKTASIRRQRDTDV